MTKHYKNKTKRARGMLIPLLLGGLLIIAAALVFLSQGGPGGTPALSVDQTLIDYGDVNFGVQKTLSIKVTNTGTGTLRFSETPYVQVLEGC